VNAIVVDASVVVAWCFNDDASGVADETLRRLGDAERWMPSLLPIELANTLALAEKKKRATRQEIRVFFEDFESVGIEVDPEASAHAFHEIYGLCREYELTAYDAVYLELALRKGAALATLDLDLRRAAVQAGVSVVGVKK
jgi:predicted nucleic acid-binding protein